MQIIHIIDDFLFDLFPKAKTAKDIDVLKQEIEEYYTYGPFRPKVRTEQNLLIIEIDTPSITNQEKDYKRVVSFCEKGDFNSAKPILSKLLKDNPTNSEYYRIFGQIYSEEGDQDKAINYLIDSLKWFPKNGFALIMLGNIFSRYKNDISTALQFYNRAIELNPNDNIAINNVGANLMQQGKTKEAITFFEKAYAHNPKYPNTLYALALVHQSKGDLPLAFEFSIDAIRNSKSIDPVNQQAIQLSLELAKVQVSSNVGDEIFTKFRHKLEFECGKEIDVIEDSSISTAAKIEFAEYHKRAKHTLRFKGNYPAIAHLKMHELMHLALVLEARGSDKNGGYNKLFTSNSSHRAIFDNDFKQFAFKLKKEGLPEASIEKYYGLLFNGILNQIFNAPIDLFIEFRLFNDYKDLRPYQYLSLYNLIREGIQAVTNKDVIHHSPPQILSISRILNLINAIQYRELYGIDLINHFKAPNSEYSQASKLYNEFLEYSVDKEPGEEYDLIHNWAVDLKLDRYFELIDEFDQNQPTTIDDYLKDPEEAILSGTELSPSRQRELDKFLKSQAAIGLNMAVVMYMVSALEFFSDLPKEKTKNIAFDIAFLGTQGIKPEKHDYKLTSIPGKTFTGYHLLAYYYVSWAIAVPEMLSKLQLPYDKEYDVAKTLFKS